MKIMSLCAAIFALALAMLGIELKVAALLWVGACGWALLMWNEPQEGDDGR